jgi:hypothetical protein
MPDLLATLFSFFHARLTALAHDLPRPLFALLAVASLAPLLPRSDDDDLPDDPQAPNFPPDESLAPAPVSDPAPSLTPHSDAAHSDQDSTPVYFRNPLPPESLAFWRSFSAALTELEIALGRRNPNPSPSGRAYPRTRTISQPPRPGAFNFLAGTPLNPYSRTTETDRIISRLNSKSRPNRNENKSNENSPPSPIPSPLSYDRAVIRLDNSHIYTDARSSDVVQLLNLRAIPEVELLLAERDRRAILRAQSRAQERSLAAAHAESLEIAASYTPPTPLPSYSAVPPELLYENDPIPIADITSDILPSTSAHSPP